MSDDTYGYKLQGEVFVQDESFVERIRSSTRKILAWRFICPRHKEPLKILDDYNGGGSHYWELLCNSCQHRFFYDTYRFVLEEAK